VNKKTLLVIEDDEDLLSALIDLLEFKGFNILSAGDGFLGLQLARTHQPDLILCDLNLPKLNGLCVLEKLLKELGTSKIPFILFTADTNSEIRRQAMELGANDYLIKPLDIHALVDSITHQLQGRDSTRSKGKSMD
jgi:DNA-binding response OmpR family regulator